MVLSDVEVEKVLVWEVFVAVRAPVHVRLVVVHFVVLERGESEGPVGRKRAVHDDGGVVIRRGGVGVKVNELDFYRLGARIGCWWSV